MSAKLTGFDFIDKLSSELWDLCHFLHKNPEQALVEFKAHDYLCKFLEEKEFKVERNFILQTGFRAVYETGSGPHVVIIVEYDALPHLGHASGHNLTAECSIAAGLGLMEIMKLHNVKGKLTLLGTPAEESSGGKINFVSSNFFHDVDAAMVSCPWNENVCHNPLLCCVDYFIRFKGQEAHAVWAPWESKNALDAAVLAYQSLSCLRQQLPPKCLIHGIITRGGDAVNTIPNFTEMKYRISADDKKTLTELTLQIFACFEAAALATGCQVEFQPMSPVYEHMNSNAPLLELFENNAKSLSIPFIRERLMSSASSDIGNVSNVCPTIRPMFYTGCSSKINTEEFAEAAGSKNAQSYVLTQAKIMMGTLLDILTDGTGQIREKVKEDFKRNEGNS